MYCGIDIGTSGAKVVIVDEDDTVVAAAGHRFSVSRPHPLWSEQDPELWWQAVCRCLDRVAAEQGDALRDVKGIGLSGQMLGPVLLDIENKVLRPAILWNDGRAEAEAQYLSAAAPEMGTRVGCRPNANFVAPKILWLRTHEPGLLERCDCLLFAKDYIALQLTGERATEPTDACGTHVMDAATGRWAADLLDLATIDPAWLPRLGRGYEAGGVVLPRFATRWGFSKNTVVALGAGDNMAGAIGVGAGTAGDGVVSIGTSAVCSIVTDRYLPLPELAIFTHPHIMPASWVSMSVVLSATDTLDWAARLLRRTVPELVEGAERVVKGGLIGEAPLLLPYLNGIRTPHDRAAARGMLVGLDLSTDLDGLCWSLLEGIGFHIAEGIIAQFENGIVSTRLQGVGGGSRSRLWIEIIATLLNRPIDLPYSREVGASLGAARLARVAANAAPLSSLCEKPAVEILIEPAAGLAPILTERFARYKETYHQVAPLL
jgi:xylulokinase